MFKKIDVTEALKTAQAKFLKDQKKWNGTSAFKPAMKYYKRLEVFKASNVSFDPDSMVALSYNWWEFVKVIGGKVVFNNNSYSPSTSKHQNHVRNLLNQLGVKIDLTIDAPRGLQNLSSAIAHAEYKIKKLEEARANPRSRNGKNEERAADIRKLQNDIKTVNELIAIENRASRFESEAA